LYNFYLYVIHFAIILSDMSFQGWKIF